MENTFRNSAWLYDVDSRDILQADIPFYIDYALRQNGEVLELGCGTGRVALGLAEQGIRVTGLDLSEQMLDVFRRKLDAKPDLKELITLVHGDMADFKFQRRFALVIAPFRAFQSLTEDGDIANSLECVRDALNDDGIFIINVFRPYMIMDENWCYSEKVQWERLDEITGNYVVKKHWGDKIDTRNQVIYPHFAYEVTDKNGIKKRITDDLKLKYYYENQLRAIIEKAGFIIKESFGWYDKSSVEEAKREIILVCGKIN